VHGRHAPMIIVPIAYARAAPPPPAQLTTTPCHLQPPSREEVVAQLSRAFEVALSEKEALALQLGAQQTAHAQAQAELEQARELAVAEAEAVRQRAWAGRWPFLGGGRALGRAEVS
jgi:hypothetical protein